MEILRIPCGPLSVNSYIVYRQGTDACAVIDPGDAEVLLARMAEEGLRCTHILLTHGHFDHIFGLSDLARATGAEVCIHGDDAQMLADSRASLATMLRVALPPVTPNRLLMDGEQIEAGGCRFRVLHTPGHTQGGVCLVEDDVQAAFCGDTIFFEGVGRTDFPHSDAAMLMDSITRKIFSLDDATTLYPGHGEETTVGHERKHNPYLCLGGRW